METSEEQRERTACQSCGMTLFNPDEFGTNSDGTANAEYCKTCFRNGRFVEPKISLDKMIEKVAKGLAGKMNLSEDMAVELARKNIPSLKRWAGS